MENIVWHFYNSRDMMREIVGYYDFYGLRYNEVIIKVNDVKYLLQRLLHLLAVKRIVTIPLIEYSKEMPENITEIFTYNKGDWYLPSQAKLSVEFKKRRQRHSLPCQKTTRIHV